MKKVIILALTLVSYTVNAQLTVVSESKVKDSTVWKTSKPYTTLPKLMVYIKDSTEDYTLFYKNAKYTHISDIKYLSIGNKQSVKDFLNLCIDVIDNDKQYNIELNKDLYILSKKGNSVMVFKQGAYFFFPKGEIEEVLNIFK